MAAPNDPAVPLRTCIGCRSRLPQADLQRCVLGANGLAHVDRHGDGRGAWLCGAACFDVAVRRSGFQRAWRRSIEPASLERLRDELA